MNLTYPGSYRHATQILRNKNRIKNPNWQEATSWLFTNVAEDLSTGWPRTNPASCQSGTWTQGCLIVSPTRLTMLVILHFNRVVQPKERLCSLWRHYWIVLVNLWSQLMERHLSRADLMKREKCRSDTVNHHSPINSLTVHWPKTGFFKMLQN